MVPIISSTVRVLVSAAANPGVPESFLFTLYLPTAPKS
jgi:hypothetical protein